MLYSILLQACKWLEYCTCYCIVSAEARSRFDTDRLDYEKLTDDLVQTTAYLFDQVFKPIGNGSINYDCFI